MPIAKKQVDRADEKKNPYRSAVVSSQKAFVYFLFSLLWCVSVRVYLCLLFIFHYTEYRKKTRTIWERHTRHWYSWQMKRWKTQEAAAAASPTTVLVITIFIIIIIISSQLAKPIRTKLNCGIWESAARILNYSSSSSDGGRPSE